MSNINIHAIIPARGGSKGIPRKNIIDYKGKPLIAHSIELALKCPLIDKVIVSTDDEEIAKIAKDYGADVPFIRPQEYAEDESRDIEFFQHYLEYLQSIIADHKSNISTNANTNANTNDETNTKTNKIYSNLKLDAKIKNKINNIFPDVMIHLRPTSPNRTLEDLTNIINTFINPDVYHLYDSLRTVVPVNKSPFKMYELQDWNVKNNKKELLVPLFLEKIYNWSQKRTIHEPYNAPRQVLPKCYVHDGYVDIVKTLTIYNKRSVTGDLIYPYIRDITPKDICDIDTPTDLI